MLVLDSNHTHDHVLSELEVLAPLLPVGSYVLVADTLDRGVPRWSLSESAVGPGQQPDDGSPTVRRRAPGFRTRYGLVAPGTSHGVPGRGPAPGPLTGEGSHRGGADHGRSLSPALKGPAQIALGLGLSGVGTVVMIAGASRMMSEGAFASFVTWWVTATLVAVIFGVFEVYLARSLVGVSGTNQGLGRSGANSRGRHFSLCF